MRDIFSFNINKQKQFYNREKKAQLQKRTHFKGKKRNFFAQLYNIDTSPLKLLLTGWPSSSEPPPLKALTSPTSGSTGTRLQLGAQNKFILF